MTPVCICHPDSSLVHPDCKAHERRAAVKPTWNLIADGTPQDLGTCAIHEYPVRDECPSCEWNGFLAWEASR